MFFVTNKNYINYIEVILGLQILWVVAYLGETAHHFLRVPEIGDFFFVLNNNFDAQKKKIIFIFFLQLVGQLIFLNDTLIFNIFLSFTTNFFILFLNI